jgi:heptosyltransferase-2
MHASLAFASNNEADTSRPAENLLICGVNWIGDSIMTMPALQTFREQHPQARISLLVKPALVSLWQLHGVPEEIIPLRSGWEGTWQTVHELKQRRFDRAIILPHSFRSALIPFLARIPKRTGMPGHFRNAMLTQIVRPATQDAGRYHQAYEYADLLLRTGGLMKDLSPRLALPEDLLQQTSSRLATVPFPRVALIPGAARGPSKRWPAENFAETGRRLLQDQNVGLIILGSKDEHSLCTEIETSMGGGARVLNLAGRTSLPELVATLSQCQLAITNDSGGMHLAVAAGTAIVAIYGITDPEKTGPLGHRHVILQNSPIRQRDIKRESELAAKCLASITPDQVVKAAIRMLEKDAGKHDAGT